MQEQIKLFNDITNMDNCPDDIRIYAEAMARFCWSFEFMKREADKLIVSRK